jgi:hypothetical protein
MSRFLAHPNLARRADSMNTTFRFPESPDGRTARSGRSCVIIQPCFLPWRGHFDLLSRGDVVVFLDDVQFVKNSWYNRNRIATAAGPRWITVPVARDGLHTLIRDKRIAPDPTWRRRLLNALQAAYGRSPYFEPCFASLTELIFADWTHMSDLAQATVKWAFAQLGRTVEFRLASDLGVAAGDAVERIIAICAATGATRYISGPAARAYIHNELLFRDHGIILEWMTYSYPDYPQRREFRDSPLSIVDLLFNTGDRAPLYIWGQS